MRTRQQPEFAELMIVNPVRPGSGTVLLGQDGVFYHVQSPGPVEEPPQKGQFFMGDDGALYRLQAFARTGRTRFAGVSLAGLPGKLAIGYGRYFLGEDGALYELMQ